MKLEDRRVKIAQLANTIMKLENRLVKIVQLGKIQQQVHLIVKIQFVAILRFISDTRDFVLHFNFVVGKTRVVSITPNTNVQEMLKFREHKVQGSGISNFVGP